MRTNIHCSLIAAAVIALLATNSRAMTITMQQLVEANAGQYDLTLGDVTFSDWGFSGPGPGCGISITATKLDPLCYQLTFGLTPSVRGKVSLPGESGKLHYSVSTTSGDPVLAVLDEDFGLTFAAVNGIGISQTVFNSAHQPLSDPTASKVWVTKEVGLFAVPKGPVTATLCGATHHADVPDGASTLCLLGIALSGLAGMRRMLGRQLGL